MTKSYDNKMTLILGYNLDDWQGFGKKETIKVDISPLTNSHVVLCGISGLGKSYCENAMVAKLAMKSSDSKFYFADYKQDDSFAYLRKSPRYYPYRHTLEALEDVYMILQKRQSGEDKSRYPVTLIWDEYVANMLSLQNEDKKKATAVMNKCSEILMLGRSLSVRLFCSCQRPDASVFLSGSRLNYGIIMILGAPIRSIYEMLIPKEYIDQIGDRRFGRGEGIILLQGSELHFVKVPTVQNVRRMQELCIKALSE